MMIETSPNGLPGLLAREIRQLHNAEYQIKQALPRYIEAATSTALKRILENYLILTEKHIDRLTDIGVMLDIEIAGPVCKGLKGIIEESDGLVFDIEDRSTRDAAIIGAVQKIGHYGIASYTTAATQAKRSRSHAEARLLTKSRTEESASEKKLSGIAMPA